MKKTTARAPAKKSIKKPTEKPKFDAKACKAQRKLLDLHEDAENYLEEIVGHLVDAKDFLPQLSKSCAKLGTYEPNVVLLKGKLEALITWTKRLAAAVSAATEKVQKTVDKLEENRPKLTFQHQHQPTFIF